MLAGGARFWMPFVWMRSLKLQGFAVSEPRGASISSFKDTSTWSVNRTLHPPHYDGVSSIAVCAKHGKFYSGSRDRRIRFSCRRGFFCFTAVHLVFFFSIKRHT